VCVFVGVFLSGFLSFQKKPVYYLGALPFFLLNILIRSSPACSRKKNKPEKHRHLKPLYVKGYVDGKPMMKMLVDGGAAVNLMYYTTYRKLGKGPEDLIKTDMMLRDF